MKANKMEHWSLSRFQEELDSILKIDLPALQALATVVRSRPG